jgi:hypothetical protein
VRAHRALYSAEPSLSLPLMFALVQGTPTCRGPGVLRAARHHHRDGRVWQPWDDQAAQAYHMLGRFEEELALARAAKAREPRYYLHWAREVGALAALGRIDEIERIITESHGLETPGAPVSLMNTAAVELSLHGRPEEARPMRSGW